MICLSSISAGEFPIAEHLLKIFERNDFGAVGNAARDELAQLLADMDVSVNRFEERRESLRARLAVRG